MITVLLLLYSHRQTIVTYSDAKNVKCNLTINNMHNLGIVVPYLTSKETRSQAKCRTWSIKEDTIKAAWKESF